MFPWKESTTYRFHAMCFLFCKKSGFLLQKSLRRRHKAADRRSDVELMGFLDAGNTPMVGMTVSVAVAIEESLKK